MSVILATTHPTEAYGGLQLHRQVLEDLAAQVGRGAIPMVLHHDSRQRVPATNVTAGVRERDDGFLEAWAEYDVPLDHWLDFKSGLDATGAPGGMSFKLSTPFVRTSDNPLVRIAVDAHHFSDEERIEVAKVLGSDVPARVERLMSFGYIPPVLAVVSFALEVLRDLPANVLGSFLYEALAKLVGRSSEPTIFDLELTEGDRKVVAHVETASRRTLKRALKTVEAAARQPEVEILDYCEGEGWKRVEVRRG